ncbi:MAG: hypothetical protein APR53_07020 [Methanoculleus sp. SDB]|nr:MAG: hypothetical protein APR53_07020 [Methanoculleus sp. SDB]
MIGDFIYKYYVGPIVNGEAYTIVDTLTYAAILIVSVYLVYRWLNRTGLPIDREFTYATIPYVILGGLLRVVEDTGMIPSPWHVLLVTPLIFFVVFFIAVIALILSRTCALRGWIRNYWIGYGVTGGVACGIVLLVLAAFGLTVTRIAPEIFLIITGMAVVATLVVLAILMRGVGWTFLSDPLYILLIFGHMLDASATSYGIDLHPLIYIEQHVVGSALIQATGTAFSMFPLKLAVVIPALYVLELYRKDGNRALWHLVILAMIMVGLAPGIRDMMRMVLYV